MSIPSTSTPDFFEAMYRQNPDPWDFAGSSYERRRYDAIMKALSHRRYVRGFEPGCSVGVLTERLAALCDCHEATDFSPTAVATARSRCAPLQNVVISCASASEYLPTCGLDLLVMSEIGYYFKREDWTRISAAHVERTRPGATILGAHWLMDSADHRMSGDEVHSVLEANRSLRLEYSERHDAFRLDRWVRL